MEVTVHLSPETLLRVDSFAAAWGYSRAEAVSVLFRAGLDTVGDPAADRPMAPLQSSILVSTTMVVREGFLCPQCGSSQLERCGTDYRCLDCWKRDGLL